MKILLTILIILQLVVIWFFFLKGNVRFSLPCEREKKPVKSQNEIPVNNIKKQEIVTDVPDEDELVPKSTIKIKDLRQALSDVLPDVLPGIVKEQVAEIMREQEVEFDDASKESSDIRVSDIDKAFEDNRIEGIAEGQIPAPIDNEDDSVPDFNELDKSLRIISDRNATEEQKANAMKVAVSVQDSNIVVALPEPLHTQLVDMLADFNAKEIDSYENRESSEIYETASKHHAKHKLKSPKKIPDNIEDFNPREY